MKVPDIEKNNYNKCKIFLILFGLCLMSYQYFLFLSNRFNFFFVPPASFKFVLTGKQIETFYHNYTKLFLLFDLS